MSRHHCRLLHHVRRLIARLWPGQPDYRVSITGPRFALTNLLTDEDTRMAFELRDSDPGFSIKLDPDKDRNDQPETPGKLEWTCSDSAILAIEPSADGLSCVVKPAHPVKLGTATVTVKDLSHPNLARKSADFVVLAEDLTGYTMTVTPLPAEDPATPASAPTGDAAPAVLAEAAGEKVA